MFTSAYSASNVIVTDSINSYPTNDTSSFMIKEVAGLGFLYGHTATLAGKYYVNSDTLTDYGMIEFSPDNGGIWIDLLNDSVLIDTASNFYWTWEGMNNKPTLTGNSNQWKDFEVNIASFGEIYNIQVGDSIIYRFTFISDSNQTNKDGLMFDNFRIEDWVEGLEELNYSSITSKSFPNPAQNKLTISFKNEKKSSFEIFIYDILGNEISRSETNSNSVNLIISNYKKGTYFYTLKDHKNKKYTQGKFIIE